ncbi:MAG: peptidase C39 family protein [Elusimicrobia bacterium]|nr:peptidase C39 family protein [Elusimicrobiota bacterium]
MKPRIPYYAQSAEFTCGPACVLMALKRFDPSLPLNRTLEFEVWRQCNMIGVPGADPYGLCVPLQDAGLKVRLVTQWKSSVDAARWRGQLEKHGFDAEQVSLTVFGMIENRRRALSRRVPVRRARPTVALVARRIRAGWLPIALVHMGVVHRLDIPHWVVVAEADAEAVTFNDPYPPKGRQGNRVSPEQFQKMLDDVGTRSGMSPSVLFVKA